jgi:hypothetical protein
MLHITDGESVAGTLRQSGLPGEVLIDGDLLYGGPLPFQGALASQLSSRFTEHEETILWFDHCLSNQLLLIRALHWFSHQNLSGRKLSIIFAGRSILGSLPADRLASLAPTRVPAAAAHFDVAGAAWTAFASNDPSAIQRILASDTSALPFLAPALARYLEEFPSAQDGLSRTQRLALMALRDDGPLQKRALFFAVQRLEETPFMGDLSFYAILDSLASGREPLIQGWSEGGPSAITEAGMRVLDGRARNT